MKLIQNNSKTKMIKCLSIFNLKIIKTLLFWGSFQQTKNQVLLKCVTQVESQHKVNKSLLMTVIVYNDSDDSGGSFVCSKF